MQQQMTTYPIDGQLCVKVASVDLLLCVFWPVTVFVILLLITNYRNWTSWLNPKIHHCHMIRFFEEPEICFWV